MEIKENIRDILAECRAEGNVVYLPQRQLERADYEAVNKVLSALGGKWNRKAKGHVFDYEPEEDVTGYRIEFGNIQRGNGLTCLCQHTTESILCLIYDRVSGFADSNCWIIFAEGMIMIGLRDIQFHYSSSSLLR